MTTLKIGINMIDIQFLIGISFCLFLEYSITYTENQKQNSFEQVIPIYLPAPEVNCSKGLPKLSIYKIPMGSDSEASITIKNINEQNIFLLNLHSNIMLEIAIINTKVVIK